MQRFGVIGVVSVVALACAACGGSKHSSAPSLPAPLVKQIRAVIRNPSMIIGASSAKTAEVYGPASHVTIEKASSQGYVSESPHVPGAWYLIVLHGHFVCNCPVPPTVGPNAKGPAKPPHGDIAMITWSPRRSAVGGEGFSVGRRIPPTVSRLTGPTMIHLG